MTRSEDLIRCTKLSKKILLQKKGLTGHSIPKLVEYAVMNMPYLPSKKFKKMNKKGNYPDVVSYIVLALTLVFVIGIVLMFVQNFDSNIQSMNDSVIPAEVKTTSQEYSDWLPTGIDYLFLSLFMVFVAFSVFAARLIPSTPKFIFVFVFALILLPFVALFVENIWDGWQQQTQVASAMSNMLFMPFIMNHLVIFITLYCAGIGIALLSKEKG